MEKGKTAARLAALIIICSCSKPNINGVANGVVTAVNGLSENIKTSLKGGHTLEEAKRCQEENFEIKKLEVPTKAILNITIKPDYFSLYTEENSYFDFDPPSWYSVDLKTRILKTYTSNWLGKWDDGVETPLPPTENEKLISQLKTTSKKKKLPFSNVFQLPRSRLGVGMGLSFSIFSERDPSISLSDAELYAVSCAGALNSYFEALMKTEYEFRE